MTSIASSMCTKATKYFQLSCWSENSLTLMDRLLTLTQLGRDGARIRCVWHGSCMETLLLNGHYKCASLISMFSCPQLSLPVVWEAEGKSYGFTCDVVACWGHSSNSNNIILLLITAVLLLFLYPILWLSMRKATVVSLRCTSCVNSILNSHHVSTT